MLYPPRAVFEDALPDDWGRRMVSLRTLCKERPGIYVHSYSHLAQVLRKHSASPADDLALLYRHMLFNAAIGNVDDHLKNFWMLARPGGFRLSPAFDLVPDLSGRVGHASTRSRITRHTSQKPKASIASPVVVP
jgi:serine/threonine-protein kinase HipA